MENPLAAHLDQRKFEQEYYLTQSEAATLLKGLAQEIEAGGQVEASSGTWSLKVNPMQPIKLEVHCFYGRWK